MGPISLLVWALVVLVIAYIALYLVDAMPVARPVKVVLSAIVGLAALLWLLSKAGVL